jgi:hypothetical protein
MNRSYLAHIVADRPDGPRGDPEYSDQLKASSSNIMLLCDAHHRLVDVEDVDRHPVDLLRRYKQEHEERIERQTAIQTNRRTEMVLFGSRIAERQGLVSMEQARAAVLSEERYPASENGIQIAVADLDFSEADPEYWDLVPKLIDRKLLPYLNSLEGPTGYPINHLSVFALAPIPALIYLGKRMGDIIAAEIFQRQRSTDDWKWLPLEDPAFAYILERPTSSSYTSAMAVNLSLSGTVVDAEIGSALGSRIPTYKLRIADPRPDFLRAKEQLELFRTEWRCLLSEIRARFGEECEVHLFPAIPNSVAVEIGRSLLPKVDPKLVIYDYDANSGGFRRKLVV